MFSRSFALICLSSLVIGCGWHLRGLDGSGSGTAPAARIEIDIPVLRLQTDSEYYDFNEFFTSYLDDLGIDHSSSASDAPLLIIHSSITERENATLNQYGHADSFVLHYAVEYELQDADGNELIGRNSILANRDLELDIDQVAAEIADRDGVDINEIVVEEIDLSQYPTLIDEESEYLNDEMEQELSEKILEAIQDALAPEDSETEPASEETEAEAEPAPEEDGEELPAPDAPEADASQA